MLKRDTEVYPASRKKEKKYVTKNLISKFITDSQKVNSIFNSIQ